MNWNLSKRVFNHFNLEKSISYWQLTEKHNYNQLGISEKFINYSFYDIIALYLFSLLMKKKMDFKITHNCYRNDLKLIVLYVIFSFRKDWNHELLQNLDLFPNTLISGLLEFKTIFEETDCKKIAKLPFLPFSYILGIDLKSTQNKILQLEPGKNESVSFSLNLYSKNIFNTIKIYFFADFGLYLQHLFLKKKGPSFSKKQNFSKACFYNYLLVKSKKIEQKKIKFKKENTKLIFLNTVPQKQNYKSMNSVILKRKKNSKCLIK